MVYLGRVSTSAWKLPEDLKLSRKVLTFKLNACNVCGHSALKGSFTNSVFEFLYKPNSKGFSPQVVTENAEINRDIINYTKKYFEKDNLTVIDFGCGDLALLKQVNEGTGNRKRKLIGVDFAYVDPKTEKDILYIRGDLTRLQKISKLKDLKFDMGYLVHTLEHLPKVKDTLLSIRSLMHNESQLYIEVPANDVLSKVDLKALDLITPQHIQYFSEDSLSTLVNVLGFEVVKKEKKITNNIPRLKMIIKKKKLDENFQILRNASLEIDGILKKAASEIFKISLKSERVGIWGIGADFYSMLELNKKLKKEISNDKFIFIDSYLEGKSFLNKKIVSLNKVHAEIDVIIVTPLPEHVRKSMMSFAQSTSFSPEKFFDPYNL
jgi:hypothetical protein